MMQRYFFHMRSDSLWLEDTEGIILSDLEAACVEAIETGRCILDQDLARSDLWTDWRFEIATEDGEVVDSIPFALSLREH